MRRTLGALAMLALAGCATTMHQVATSEADRPVAEEALTPDGTATITGSALIRQRGGGVVTCAGNEVHLIPAMPSTSRHLRTAFDGERGFRRRGGSVAFGGGTEVVPPQPNRAMLCDAQGFFRFTNIRAGKWHIMTNVVWDVGGEYQGGALLGTVEVERDGEAEVTLSH